jgi:hypothetical protein
MASYLRSKSTKLVVQRCHWHRCDMHSGVSGVIDTAVTWTAESLTPLWYAQQCHWHRCANMTPLFSQMIQNTTVFNAGIWFGCTWHSGVIDTTVICTAKSLTSPWLEQRCHWHHCDMHSGVIDTAVTCTAESLKWNENNLFPIMHRTI